MVTIPYRFAEDSDAPFSVGGLVISALEKFERQANIKFDAMAAKKLIQLKFTSECALGQGNTEDGR